MSQPRASAFQFHRVQREPRHQISDVCLVDDVVAVRDAVFAEGVDEGHGL